MSSGDASPSPSAMKVSDDTPTLQPELLGAQMKDVNPN